MKNFMNDDLLLSNETAKSLYAAIKKLPIIDYHCHLNEREIAEDKTFANIGEAWLGGDHYKWRAMRMCGVDEHYITGEATWREKFDKYAEIMPLLAGNPLYYFSHLELKMIFGITEPLNAASSDSIWERANAALQNLSVHKLLELFNVEYIATTDDPDSDLAFHGVYGRTLVAPTFRPDRIIKSNNFSHSHLSSRLDYFAQRGCKITDHGMDFAPSSDRLEWLAEQYAQRDMTMQLHIGTMRNINTNAHRNIGVDSGFDVYRANVDTDALAVFLNKLHAKNALPKTIIYTLNPSAVPAICTISGAFPNVRVGAPWWFNDTLEGIRNHLKIIAEYATLGTFLGMLTDSRSFLSYARFDFFRRILADYVGGLVERGEYDLGTAHDLMEKLCYTNVKEFVGL